MSEVTNETNKQTTTEGTGAAVKWACVLAYLVFFLPLVVDGNKKIHRFHANQGLVLLLLCVANTILASVLVWIPFLGWFITFAIYVFASVLAIMGMVNTGNGLMKELPLIGKIKILK